MGKEAPAGQGTSAEIDPESWAKLQKQIGEFRSTLHDAMQEKLGKLGDDLVAEARSRLLASPPGGRGRGRSSRSHSSRQQAAAGLTAHPAAGGNADTVGVEVGVNAAQMGPGRQAFPFAYNKTGGWSHPVYGRRGTPWVHQQGNPFLNPAEITQKFGDRLATDMGAALEQAAATVKGSAT